MSFLIATYTQNRVYKSLNRNEEVAQFAATEGEEDCHERGEEPSLREREREREIERERERERELDSSLLREMLRHHW